MALLFVDGIEIWWRWGLARRNKSQRLCTWGLYYVRNLFFALLIFKEKLCLISFRWGAAACVHSMHACWVHAGIVWVGTSFHHVSPDTELELPGMEANALLTEPATSPALLAFSTPRYEQLFCYTFSSITLCLTTTEPANHKRKSLKPWGKTNLSSPQVIFLGYSS